MSTTERHEHGRFVVTIPLNDKVNDLGESFSMAHKRFLTIERKLIRNPDATVRH